MKHRVALALVLIAATAGCVGSGGQPTPTDTATPDRSASVGEAHVIDGVAVTVTGVEAIANDSHAGDNERAIHVIVRAENQASETRSAPSYMDYRLIADGEQHAPNEYDASYHDNTQQLLSGNTGSGYVEFIVPSSVDTADVNAIALVLENGTTLRWNA